MKKIVKRIGIIALAAVFLGSAGLNVWMWKNFSPAENIWNINFPDANSRDTYDSIHHAKAAQKLSTGAGVKVGIMDWGFGFEEHAGLYAGGKDFTTYSYHDDNFNHTSEHGFWMAQTLKEIAPDVEVYALGTYVPDSEEEWVDAMIEAIHFAMEQDMDILTLSHQALSEESRERFDAEVNKAVEQGIVTTFIHYDNPNNILPWGIWSDGGEGYYRREADINIFQYDYNTLFLDNYKEVMTDPEFDRNYKDNLYVSVSSMSVVTAGFVALLQEIDDTLTPAEYKEILIETSRPVEYAGEKAEYVVDIEAAVRYLLEKNSR
ncbi:MAG: peptidase [Lachnospiraceae bacterium]|nr:peptidase [Lachnospiraceae bacterium]